MSYNNPACLITTESGIWLPFNSSLFLIGRRDCSRNAEEDNRSFLSVKVDSHSNVENVICIALPHAFSLLTEVHAG